MPLLLRLRAEFQQPIGLGIVYKAESIDQCVEPQLADAGLRLRTAEAPAWRLSRPFLTLIVSSLLAPTRTRDLPPNELIVAKRTCRPCASRANPLPSLTRARAGCKSLGMTTPFTPKWGQFRLSYPNLHVSPLTELSPVVDGVDPTAGARPLGSVLLTLEPLHFDNQVRRLFRLQLQEKVGHMVVHRLTVAIRDLKPKPLVLDPCPNARRLVQRTSDGALPTGVNDRVRHMRPLRDDRLLVM